MTEEKQTKTWKRVGLFSTYEEALNKKNQVNDEHTEDNNLLLKIKRCGPEGSKFQVKMWHPNMAPVKKNKKTKKGS
jgi:hypothetical protein